MSDKSSVGGPEHVCGMHCDGQDRCGGCCVQDKYYGRSYPYIDSEFDLGNGTISKTLRLEKDPLTFSEFREANVSRCESVYHLVKDWSPCDWMTALTGEVGELANEIKKLRRGDNVPRENLRHEIGDVIAYIDLLAASLDIDLGEASREKFNIVSERVGSGIKL